nr:MAG TPA: hypothetical protein [Caudoviricetes sp.]
MHNNTRPHLYILTNNVNFNKDYKDNNKEYVHNAQLNTISVTRPLERAEKQGSLYLYLYIPKRIKTPYKRF